MPELPEVQALVTDLETRLAGNIIQRVDITAFSALKTFDPPVTALAGRRVDTVARHGKFIDIDTVVDAGSAAESNGSAAVPESIHIVMHLARAGWIRWRESFTPGPVRPGKGPLAARLVLDNGSGIEVTEAGTKKSLAIYVVRDVADVPGVARLGPDPIEGDFTEETLAGILAAAGRAQIKGVLRNQSTIAGIGNAYSDEILHVAKMSPFKPAAMSADEVSRLYDAIQTTLRDAVARSDGLAAADLKKEKKLGMRVHGRSGEACPVCGDVVRDVKFADNSLQYCATCQTGGRPLADRLLSRLLK